MLVAAFQIRAVNTLILSLFVIEDVIMSANTSSQDLCPKCKEKIENSKNNWVAIQRQGVNGIHEARVKRTYDLVTEAGT